MAAVRQRAAQSFVTPALAVLSLLAGVLTACTGSDSSSDVPPEPAVTSSTEAESPEDSTPPSEAAASLRSGLAGWSDPIDLPQVGDSSNVRDLVVHDGELVAVGVSTVGDRRTGAVWRSTDGESWEAVDAAGLEGDTPQWPTNVVSFDGRLIAIGWSQGTDDTGGTDPNAIGWTSNDNGANWEGIEVLPSTARAEYSLGLAVVDGSVLIAGYTIDEGVAAYRIGPDGTVLGPDAPDDERGAAADLVDFRAWDIARLPFLVRSSNGSTWENVPLDGIGLAELHAVAGMPDGSLVLAGRDVQERTTVWRQGTDGRWAAVFPRVPAAGTWVTSVQEWQGSVLVAVSGGSGGVLDPAGTWTPLPAVTLADIAHTGDRLVAVGWSRVGETDDYRIHVAEAPDAVTWSGIELPANEFLVTVVSFGEKLIAAGSRTGADGVSHPAAWTGGSTTEAVTGDVLAAADWLPPEEAALPAADVLHLEEGAWSAELVNDVLQGEPPPEDTAGDELDRANDICVATDGAVWIATEQQGAFRLVDGTWTRFGLEDGLPATAVRYLAPAPGGTIVAATVAGLAVFDGEGFVSAALPPDVVDPRVLDLLGDGATVWAATASGLLSWDGSEWYLHGVADGLPAPDVVGGELPAGLARRLWAIDGGVAAELPGLGVAAWDGSRWTMLGVPVASSVRAVGRDGAVIFAAHDGEDIVFSMVQPDGSREELLRDRNAASAAFDPDGGAWITSSLSGIYEVRDGSITLSGSLAGQRLIYASFAEAVGDRVCVRDASGLYVLADGVWSAYTAAAGLPYPLTSESIFDSGAIYHLTDSRDGTVWALSRQTDPD